MASSKDRERKLARAKIDRQQVRRAERVRSQRQIQARVGTGIALLLVVALIGWSTHWFGATSPKPVVAAECTWTPAASNPNIKDVGTPPTSGLSMTGVAPMTIHTDQGVIPITLNVTQAPCSSESFSYLASKKFFDNTQCHRLTTDGIYVLQCGDPSEHPEGTGGPSYTIPDENLPLTGSDPGNASAAPASSVIYPAGTVAIANAGPGTGGSQFFLVYKDSPLPPSYAELGTMDASGLDVVKKIAAGGATKDGKPATDGTPNIATTIQTLTVGKVVPGAVTEPSPSATPAPAPSPSVSLSPSPSSKS